MLHKSAIAESGGGRYCDLLGRRDLELSIIIRLYRRHPDRTGYPNATAALGFDSRSGFLPARQKTSVERAEITRAR